MAAKNTKPKAVEKETPAEVPGSDVSAPATETPEENKTPTVKGNVADVLGRNGQVVRTYSRDVHGESFAQYAKMFAVKIHGTCRVQ